MIDIHLDIETGDPDDLWMLALSATHPRVNLKGVTIMPGGLDQIGLAKTILRKLGSNAPVGADIKDDGKKRVGNFYREWLGDIENEKPDANVEELMENNKGSTLLTGAALTNIDKAKKFSRWTCQGGFVSSSLLTKEQTLEKFAGKDTVPTYNLNGNPKVAKKLLIENNKIFDKIFMVGKNVCHGFIFSQEKILSFPIGKHDGLNLAIDGMNFYCYYRNKPEGKAMHDILAFLLHMEPSGGMWIVGAPFRGEKGHWGFSASPEGKIKALIAINNREELEEKLWL